MPATFDREAVRAANKIERVIPDLLGQHPKAVGGELKVRCCFHDDEHPSLRLNLTKQVWRCDVCNIGGDVFDFVMRREGRTFPDALTFLADRAGIPSASSSHGRHGRGNGNGHAGCASSSALQPAHWPPEGMLRSYNYYPDGSGFIARKVRYADRPGRGKCGWFHSRDAGATWFHGMGCDDPGLYGIDEAVAMLGKTDAVIIAEGERDARRLLDLKWPAVSPPHGASLNEMGEKWRPAYTERLREAGFARAYVIGDHDAVGEGEPGRANGFNGGIARALNAAGIDARPVPWDAVDPVGYDITDFCDEHGSEAKALLRDRIEAAKADLRWVDPAPPEDAANSPRVPGGEDPGRVRPILRCLAEVSPEDVTWIWRGRVAAGKLNLIAGDPGLGKSFVTLDLIARYTTGRPLPDGSPGIPSGTAILLSAEDGLGDTIRPRLDALGADVQRVHYVATVIDGRQERSIQLADVEALEEAILTKDAGLVVIDPLSAYVGDTDSHRDAAVRGLLAPLAQLADRYRVTILGVIHLSKNSQRSAIHRAIGSIAFVGAARVVLAVAADPENEQRRLLAPVKNNLSSPAPVLAFSIPDGRLVYEPQPVVGMDINDVLRGPTFDRQERRDADEWLSQQLAEGPVLVKELMREAKAAGISWSTVERAKARGKVVARRVGFSGPWSWVKNNLSSPAPVLAFSKHSPKAVTDTDTSDGLWQIPKDSSIDRQSDSVTVYGRSGEAHPTSEIAADTDWSVPLVPLSTDHKHGAGPIDPDPTSDGGPVNGEQLPLPLATDEASGPRGPARTRRYQAPPRAPQEPWTPLAQRPFVFDPDPIGRPHDP